MLWALFVGAVVVISVVAVAVATIIFFATKMLRDYPEITGRFTEHG